MTGPGRMPDDDGFDGLDDLLRRQVTPLPPPPGTFDRVYDRARARRRRRATVASSAAAVLLVAGGAGVATGTGLLDGRHTPSPLAGAPLTPSPTSAALSTPAPAGRSTAAVRPVGPGPATSSANRVPPTLAPTAGSSAPPDTAPPDTRPPDTAPPDTASPSSPPPRRDVPRGFVPTSASFTSPDVGWALGDAPCASPPCLSLVHTADGGRSWTGSPAPRAGLAPGVAAADLDVRFADRLDGWVYGGPGLWATHDGGATWRQVGRLPVTDLEASAGHVWALVLAQPSGRSTLVTSAVTDDPVTTGTTFTPTIGTPALVPHGSHLYTQGGSAGGAEPRQTSPCDGPELLATAVDGSLLAVCPGESGAGPVWASADGGRSWTRHGASPGGGTAASLAAGAPGRAALAKAGPQAPLLVTTDGGVTWRAAAVATRLAPQGFSYVGFTDADHGVAVAAGATSPVLLVTRDGGTTWQPSTPAP